jgi:hypothetical protein
VSARSFAESIVERAALARLDIASRQVLNGAEICPGESAAERDDYGRVVCAQPPYDSFLPLVSGDLRPRVGESFVGRVL